MDEVSFFAIVSVAFLSSFSHCVGMCGGFVSMQILSLKELGKFRTFLLILNYHFFRTLSYAILGGIFAYFGSIFTASMKARALLFFAVGIFLIFVSVALFFRGKFLQFLENERFTKTITRSMLKVKFDSNFLNFSLFGFLNGLLPCGLVYYFLAMAILSENFIQGVLVMAVFGLGTIPAMFIFSMFLKFISQKFRQLMFVISIFIIFINGIYLTYLGFATNG